MTRAKLAAMRKAKFLSQDDVAYRIRKDRTTVSRYETGELEPGVAACRAMAALYEVSFDELWEAVESNGDGTTPAVSLGWWSNYEALEQSAVTVRTWEPMVVPGLLQSEGYARALGELGGGDDLVERRMARQIIITRDHDPAEIVALLDESVLRRPIGGAEVLAEQLRHLLTMAERPNVTVQIVPFDAAPLAEWGAFLILTFPWPGGLVYLQHKGGARSLDHPYEIEVHADLLDRLRHIALSPSATEDRIQGQLMELER